MELISTLIKISNIDIFLLIIVSQGRYYSYHKAMMELGLNIFFLYSCIFNCISEHCCRTRIKLVKLEIQIIVLNAG